MKEDVAKEWVAALRSGEYKQARGMLKDETCAMCCLGVLCDLSKIGEWAPRLYDHRLVHIYAPKDGENGCSLGTPPNAVQQWAGMKSRLGNVGVKTLAELNDQGATFDEIADIIENSWETL